MKWIAQAPSNIALIKYIGKKNKINNLPINSSLSYTLNRFKSTVLLEYNKKIKQDLWKPLLTTNTNHTKNTFSLSISEQKRFLKHLSRIKTYFNYKGSFIVQSNNNFPISAGISSSASSFAALTKCAILAISTIKQCSIPSIIKQADISRIASGSSCRSFFSPWALWKKNNSILSPKINYTNLKHQIILIDKKKKCISSTQAHHLIETSTYFKSRHKRADNNLKKIFKAIKYKNWKNIYKICWKEFFDLHTLFITSKPSFTYINQKTKNALLMLKELWKKKKDGPIVTMDAGPNIHLLYRTDQKKLALNFKNYCIKQNYDIL
ncbi:diphosphomevalonate decarboxylase [Candidatus Legionella polyplacis]|uniref:Diphosphomevalonate decarboxylase n=1 Tax=Candidatus Legionella polyplacis TaxID=2005262 RepID=A0ABZ2GV61_9GAMM|nr:diphosphomevalonate decarboxylase [Candidatus Legionella polyplacis]ATW01879.1 diphosphomevalonate decarboxylase [Candidatus Legionella polyplacis]